MKHCAAAQIIVHKNVRKTRQIEMSKKSVDSARWSWERRLVSGWSNNDGSRHFRVHESMKNGCNVLGANFSSGFLLTGKNNERRRRRAAAALALLAMQQWRDSSTFLMDSAPTPSCWTKLDCVPQIITLLFFQLKPKSKFPKILGS